MSAHEHGEPSQKVAKFGARANALLGVAQAAFAAFSGNSGFCVEAGHQASDAASFEAKARAMGGDQNPRRVNRLRKLAVSALFAGSAAGFIGGGMHLINNTKENSDPVELGGSVVSALVNTVIAERSHRSNRDNDRMLSGTSRDTQLHILADVSTSWIYAGSLAAEHVIPGIANYTLMLNGAIIGYVAVDTTKRIQNERAGQSSFDHHNHDDTHDSYSDDI